MSKLKSQDSFIDAANYIAAQAGIYNIARGFNGQWMYDSWQDSRYKRDECNFAIGYDAITNLDEVVKIHSTTPVHIIVLVDGQQSALHPERINSIPLIDDLERTKLWRLIE